MLKKSRLRIKKRTKAQVEGTAERPRLSVFRSNKYIYAQLINDAKAVTLAAAKGSDPKEVGTEIAALGLKKKIKHVVFDRSGFRFHGRVKALADAAREKGLVF
jgi:large subunit ribosomal protein L18